MKGLKDKKFIKKLFQLDDTPKSVASGFALGSFIGMIPIPGFQWMVAIPLAHFLRWNKKAAFIAVFNTNVFTGLAIFAFNFWLGKKVLGITPAFSFPDRMSIHFVEQILLGGYEVFLCMLTGGVITGIPVTIISYYIVLYLMKQQFFQKKNESGKSK